MSSIEEFIIEQARLGENPPEIVEVNGTTLIRTALETEKTVATVKRNTKTRKVQVLAYEEWSDGVWVKHTSEFQHVEGKRAYNARVRYSRPESIIELEYPNR